MESLETVMSSDEKSRWEQNERHGQLLARRLTRLSLRGYEPVFSSEMDTFDLVHPNPRATPVQLWADGQLVDRYPTEVEDGKRTIIYPEDEQLFATFLAQVPRPSFLQMLLEMKIGEGLKTLTAWLIFLGVVSLFSAAADAIWRAAKSR